MTPNLLLEYFKETRIFKNFEEFIKAFCNLDLHLYSLESTSVNNNITINLQLTSSSSPPPKDLKHLKHVQRALVEQCIEEREPLHFQTPERSKCILIPLILKDIVSGLILVEENPLYPLNKNQIQSVEKMIIDLIRNVNQHEFISFKEYKGSERSHQREILSKVTTYMSHNYNSPELSLADTARDCSVSYHYLSRLFKKELNTTFSQYLTDLRLSTSLKLLQDKRLTISEISSLCGFLDSSYFGKVFKKRFRIPPALFRRNLTKISEKKALVAQGRLTIIDRS
jgi:AraC-like DNA-binding protein